jgi:hypothetical protein
MDCRKLSELIRISTSFLNTFGLIPYNKRINAELIQITY